MDSIQDIHICGGCGSKYTDIFRFMHHKKQCSSSTSTSHSNAQTILKENSHHIIPQYFEERPSAKEVSLHTTSESQLAGCENAHVACISVGSESSLPTMLTHSSSQYNVHPHQRNLTDSNSFITWQIKHEPKKETLSNLCSSATNNFFYQDNAAEENITSSPRRASENVSFDDIAVYVVSPKSFSSSGNEQCEVNLRINCQGKLNNEVVYSVQPALSRPDTFTSNISAVINSKATDSGQALIESSSQTQTNLFHLQASCTNDSRNSLSLPISSSHPKYLIDSEITPVSEGSTPCPEDLEVGQISAAMLGEGSLHCPQRPRVETSKSKNISTDSSYSSSSSSRPEDSISYTKAFQDKCLNVPEYIRDNTASAPIIKNAVCSTRKISVEKRERLQGVSDDLLSFSPYYDKATVQNMNCVRSNLNQVTAENNITTVVLEPRSAPSAHHFPQLTGYKAIFTSPSCAGHRLNPTFLESAVPNQLVSHEKVHTTLVNETSKIPSALVYTNISAKSGLAIADNVKQSVNNGSKTKLKKVERKIVFDSTDEQPVSDICTDSASKVNKSGDTHLKNAYKHALQPDIKNEVVASLNNVILGNNASKNHLQCELSELHLISGEPPSLDKRTDALDETKHNQKDDSNASLQVMLPGGSTYCHDLIDIIPSAASTAADENAVMMFYKAVDGNYVLMPKENFSTSADIANFQTFQTSSLSDISNSNSVSQYTLQPQGLNSDVYINVIPSSSTDSSIPQLLVHNFCCPDPNFSQWIAISAGSGASSENNPGTFSNSQDSQMSVNNEVSSQNQTAMKQVMVAGDKSEKEKFIRKPKKPAVNMQSKSYSSHVKKNTASNRIKTASTASEEVVKDKVGEDGQDIKKSKAFVCKFDNCRYTTTLFKDFQRHYRRHTGERPFQCKQCDKRFSRSDKLNIHIRWHAGIKLFKCQICDYASVEGGSLKKHMRIHNDERPFKCQICSYASRNSSQLIVHLRTHTGDTPFHCTQCTAKFKINSDLKRHMRTHTGEKPFHCEFCDYKSSNKGNVKTHIRINHSKDNEISCSVCQFVTSSKKRLREHIKIHNSKQLVSCDKCDYTCTNHNALRNHANIHNAIKPYRCNFCPFTSKQSGNLKKHVQNLHLDKLHSSKHGKIPSSFKASSSANTKRNSILKSVDRPEDSRHRSSSSSYKKSYVCSSCGSSFVREDSLRCHMKQHNSDNTEGLIKDNTANLPHRSNIKETASSTDNSSYGCQGIQHIVAAASKLNEENILSEVSNENFTLDKHISNRVDSNSFRNHKESSTIHCLDSKTSNSQNLTDPIKNSSLPWEHRSYTLSTDNKNIRSAHDKRNINTSAVQTNSKQSVRYLEENLYGLSSKKRKPEALPGAVVSTDKSFHVVDTSQHMSRLPEVIQLTSSLSDSVDAAMSRTGSVEAFIANSKGETSTTLDPTYSIQLIPHSSVQHSGVTDLFTQELLGHLATHTLPQQLFHSGATKVQIVLPPSATVFESSQTSSHSRTSL